MFSQGSRKRICVEGGGGLRGSVSMYVFLRRSSTPWASPLPLPAMMPARMIMLLSIPCHNIIIQSLPTYHVYAIITTTEEEGGQRTMAQQGTSLLPSLQCMDGERPTIDITSREWQETSRGCGIRFETEEGGED